MSILEDQIRIIRILKNCFRSKLFAVVSVGSFASNRRKRGWSDIDLLVVLEEMSLKSKEKMAVAKDELESRLRCRFGINVLSKSEARNPARPAIALDGKTLQGLLDLRTHPDRLLYCKVRNPRFFVPDRKTIKDYSLSNVAMFLLRNRKTLTGGKRQFGALLKDTVEREIRAAFIVTRLAIQYRSGFNCDDHREIIDKAAAVFPRFDFSVLEKNEDAVRKWGSIRSFNELRRILERTDGYLESFAAFVLRGLK